MLCFEGPAAVVVVAGWDGEEPGLSPITPWSSMRHGSCVAIIASQQACGKLKDMDPTSTPRRHRPPFITPIPTPYIPTAGGG